MCRLKLRGLLGQLICCATAAGLSMAPGLSTAAQTRGGRYAGAAWASRSPVIAQHGIVTSEQPLASLVGVEIMKEGGSAVDAAIATSAMLSLTEPMLNGPGGDAFVMIWDPATKKLYGYNGSGTSPAKRTLPEMRALVADAYRRAGVPIPQGKTLQIPLYGSLTVTVPGLVDTWFAIHKRFGKLPMAADLAPAIHYATVGFPVTQVMARYWSLAMKTVTSSPFVRGYAKGIEDTFLPGGVSPKQGDVFRNLPLAETLSEIANGGRDAFYKGKIAHEMAEYLNKVGGPNNLTYADFASFHGTWVTPRSADYRGYKVYELPPNGQGFATLEMLNVLSGFDLHKLGGATGIGTLMAEIGAKRLAFEDLSKFYADPRFYNAPIDGLLSTKYAAARRALLNLDHANTGIGPGNPQLFNKGDTTNLATADAGGMMVSMIESNFQMFGSGLAAPKLGFVFQDRGELFSLDPGAANAYAPRKRPFHTIIPAFVMYKGQPWMAFSVMGGPFQPQGQLQILVDMIDFGENIQEASDAARWYHSGDTTPTGIARAQGAGTVTLEPGFGAEVAAGLRERGYRVRLLKPGSYAFGFGGFEGIRYHARQKTYWGGTEFRRDGEVIGY